MSFLDAETPTISSVEQGSPEWHEERRGKPSASKFKDVLAKGQGLTRKSYLHTLAGELITGLVDEGWGGNVHTERGKAYEAEAVALYELMSDNETALVGCITRGRILCSPDRLVGDDGLLEIKTRLPKLQIELLEADRVPPEHKAQLQGQLLVSGRHWVDFASHCPGLPMFKQRVYRENVYLQTLESELELFISDLDALVLKYGSNN